MSGMLGFVFENRAVFSDVFMFANVQFHIYKGQFIFMDLNKTK